jgi:multiple sugar transport system substrate-binding protein/sorbitol/mannitol transport system substrate-binding protein
MDQAALAQGREVVTVTNPATSTVADKAAFAPTPTGPAGDGAALAGWNLCISRKSSRKDAARAFITFMASREKSVDYVKAGGVVTRDSVFQNPEPARLNPSSYWPLVLPTISLAGILARQNLRGSIIFCGFFWDRIPISGIPYGSVWFL